MAQIKAYKNGAWVPVPNGGATIRVQRNGSWYTPTKIQAEKNGSWYTVWNRSDPKTVSFRATATNSYRSTGWRGANDLRAGNYYGYGTHIGLMNFTNATSTGDITGDTITEVLATGRTTLTDVKLTLHRDSSGGTNPFGAGSGTQNNYYVGNYSSAGGTFASGNAQTLLTTTNMATITYSTLDGFGWNFSESKDLTLNANVGTDAATKYVWISDMSSGWLANTGNASSPVYSEVYGLFEGDPSSSNCATLTFTADY